MNPGGEGGWVMLGHCAHLLQGRGKEVGGHAEEHGGGREGKLNCTITPNKEQHRLVDQGEGVLGVGEGFCKGCGGGTHKGKWESYRLPIWNWVSYVGFLSLQKS